MYPPSITLQRRLPPIEGALTPHQCQIIISYLKEQEVSHMSVVGNSVQFENEFLTGKHGRTHLMATISAGRFNYSPAKHTLRYQFSFWHTFIVALFMSVFLGLVSGSIAAVLFLFTWLFGMNLLTSIIRHYRWLKKIATRLECHPDTTHQ